MRSRYAAYAVGHLDHVFRTWHPRTRPDDLVRPALEWTGLEILDVVAGGPDEDEGIVEFAAHYLGVDGAGTLHERSRFERRGGRWVYVAVE
jgi:SEC-C motif-containing protein